MNSAKPILIASVSLAVLFLLSLPAGATLVSPGFESGPAVSSTPFLPTGGTLIWRACNTDGERLQSATGRLSAEGSYHASMLQNAGYTTRTLPCYGATWGATGFDRIYNTFAVTPLTTYTITFQHAADDRYGYTGENSHVSVESVDTGLVFSNLTFTTPGFYAWQTESFQFTTDAATTTACIALSALGSSNCSAMFDDVRVSPGTPTPDILIDGQNNPPPIPSTQPVSVTISLDPGNQAGVGHDWWIIAEKTGGGTFSWVYTIPWHWTVGIQRAHGGPLFALNGYPIHNGTIPVGTWTIRFAVDSLDNVYQGTYEDSITVTSY